MGLFLRLEAVIWVGVGMVMSFLGAFALMPYLDITINLSSLMGFILVLGIVVDDAIVISESCDSYRQQGLNPLDAAIQGTKRMAVPITFGVLTTVCAFLPMAFDSSDWGSMFRPIALVFITVMLIALVETKLILPSHLATPFLGGPAISSRPSTGSREGRCSGSSTPSIVPSSAFASTTPTRCWP